MDKSVFDNWRDEYTSTTLADQVELCRTVANLLSGDYKPHEYADAFIQPGKIIEIFDPACGLGGLIGSLQPDWF